MIYPPPRRQPHPSPALNAIPPRRARATPDTEPDDDARNLRYCQELIELGMTLARAAADRALDDIGAPPPVATIPGSAAGAIAEAQDLARRRAPNHGKLFAHLTRAIRQTMLLKRYLAESHAPRPYTHAAPHHTATPANANPQPDRDTLRRETLERLDCRLPTGPDGEILVDHLLRDIAGRFGLQTGPTAPPEANPGILPAKPAEPRPHEDAAAPASNTSRHVEPARHPPDHGRRPRPP